MIIGDVVGSPGREALKRCVSLLREQHQIHACIANGENAAGGFGLTAQTAEEMFASGIDFITGGNHIFDKRDFGEYLETSNRVIRPANYPPATPGRGAGTFVADGVTVAVLNLMGRTFMPPVDDPFRCADAMVTDLRRRTPVIVVDLHAEATSEKVRHGALFGRTRLVRRWYAHPRSDGRRADLPGGNRLPQRPGDDGADRWSHRNGEGARTRPVSNRFFGAVQRAKKRDETAQRGGGFGGSATGKATAIKRIFMRGIA